MILLVPAFASGPTITITTPSNPVVNNNYEVNIFTSDGANPLPHQVVNLAVTSPDNSATISSSVETDDDGYATAVLHTSFKAGYNTITATSGGASSSASIQVGPGPVNSLNLTMSYPFALADGYSTIKAMALVVDDYGNPVGNIPVYYTVDGTPAGAWMTNASGIASLNIGPYNSPRRTNIEADTSGIDPSISNRSATATFLIKNDLFLLRYPSAAVPINSNVSVVAIWYYDMAGSIPAAGVPLTFTVYDPEMSVIGEHTGITDANGMARFDFQISSIPGTNKITVNNNMMSASPIKSVVIEGILNDVSSIVLSSTPVSPILADGETFYKLGILALDKDGVPVKYKYLTVVKDGDMNGSIGVITNANGRQSVDVSASKYVQDVNMTVYASTVNNTTVSRSIILSYIAGEPRSLNVYANPFVVASADVLTPPDMPDVHRTDVTAVVTDEWGHPIVGRGVSISLSNLTQGSITGPAAGVTSDSGEFTTQFTLGSGMYGEDLTDGVTVNAVSGSLSGTCHVYYTDSSFLSVKSMIEPNTSVKVNDTINVTLTVRGIGWKIRPQNSSVSLIFDTSGSMDWMSTIIYPTDLKPETGSMDPVQNPTWWTSDIGDQDWHLIDTYNYDGGGDIQVMLSSNYRTYGGWQGSYYYLRVTDPNGNNFSTFPTYSTDVQNSQNENFVRFQNAQAGLYKIYGAYIYNPAMGDVSYNMMVLTTPKRMGQVSDHDSAAKVAAECFVANMTNNQIGVVWFNTSSRVVKHFTVDDSVNRSSINESIDGLAASGGTSIYLGLDKAIEDFNSPYYKSGNRKFIILLSDGYSQTPVNDLTSAQTAADQNITIYTIGMGMPDDVNLDAIAKATSNGTYYRVYTDAQLNDVYADIYRGIQEVVANYTEMHILSNCTYVDGNWAPDVEYVMGSGFVSYPNGTARFEDPDPLPAPDADGNYSIVWKPGVIKLNDTWSVTYSLRVLKDGNITPIRNDSYVYFIRDDGSEDTMHFGSETLYVMGNSTDTLAQSNSTIRVNITNPLPKTGAKADWPTQPIEWRVNYAGNGTYHQIIYLIDTNSVEIPVSEGYDGNANGTFSYSLPTKGLLDGNYIIRVYADDGVDTGEDMVTLIVSESKGQIILE